MQWFYWAATTPVFAANFDRYLLKILWDHLHFWDLQLSRLYHPTWKAKCWDGPRRLAIIDLWIWYSNMPSNLIFCCCFKKEMLSTSSRWKSKGARVGKALLKMDLFTSWFYWLALTIGLSMIAALRQCVSITKTYRLQAK